MGKIETGAKVVCINDNFDGYPNLNEIYRVLPKLHQVYTVREVIPTGGLAKSSTGLLLAEIRNPLLFLPSLGGKIEPAFAAERFVPLDELPPIEVPAVAERELVATL